MTDIDQKNFDNFFAACAPMMDAYREHSALSYVAVRRDGALVLLRARLRLAATPRERLPSAFSSPLVCAAHVSLNHLGADAATVLTGIVAGTLKTEHGSLGLLTEASGRHGTHFTPFHDEGLRAQNRLNVLTVNGARSDSFLPQPDLDWELKAAETPFESLTDLMLEFGLGGDRPDISRIELIADTVAFIHYGSSISGTKARVGIRLAQGLQREKASLGYRVLDGHRVTVRSRVAGGGMKWDERDGLQHGETDLDVTSGGIVHAFVSYAGVAQHHYWLSDPARLPNPHRTAFEAFDAQLDLFKSILEKAEGRGFQARDLEAAVAWLLWMNGFFVAHLGGTQTVQTPGPDIIAMTPQTGHFAVIECTTKHLGSDKKLPDLVANAEKLRRRLDAAGQGHRKILKILVTTLRAEDIAAERDDAERLGVVVLTRENIENAINRSITVPNPEEVFADALQVAQAGIDKHAGQLALSGVNKSVGDA